jgi:hypothetical protein
MLAVSICQSLMLKSLTGTLVKFGVAQIAIVYGI